LSDLSLSEIKKQWHGTFKAYVIGFTASLLLTSISFFITATQVVSGNALLYTLVGLAIVQAILQLIFFLHLGQEDKPRWESVIFSFMVLILLIISLGSLWIMNDLNSRMMTHNMEMTP
jgi:cytochrome o ubiquinol oxidase operon protein cyoD